MILYYYSTTELNRHDIEGMAYFIEGTLLVTVPATIRSYESIRPPTDSRGSPHGVDEIRSYESRCLLAEGLPLPQEGSRVPPSFSRFPLRILLSDRLN